MSYGSRALRLNSTMAPVHIILGRIHTDAGHYDEAIQDFKKALELNPFSAVAYQRMARTYRDMRNPEQAEIAYLKAIQLRPGFWSNYLNLGVFYNGQGRYEDAVKQGRKAIELAPNYYKGIINLGGYYHNMERWEEAKEMWERALGIKPNYQAYANLGTLCFYLGRYVDAVKMFEKALEFDDDDYRVWSSFAASYIWAYGSNDSAKVLYRKAIDMAEKKLEENPRDFDALSSLAGDYALMGNHSKAKTLLNQLLAVEKPAQNILFRIGEIYENLGDRESAFMWIKRSLEKGYSIKKIERNQILSDLRADERFQQLLQDVKK